MTGKTVRKSKARVNVRSKKSKKKARNIQLEVRDLTLQAITERNVTLEQLSDLASEMLDSASRTVKHMIPASRKSVLRQVLKGIDDAWAATATASVASLRHAQRYGLPLAKRDIAQLGKRLNSLEQEFVNTVNRQARRIGGDLGSELENISGQMRKAGTQIGPAAEAAQKAIMKNAPMFGQEVAVLGAKAVTLALHGLLSTAGGVLEGAGKALRAQAPRTSKSQDKAK